MKKLLWFLAAAATSALADIPANGVIGPGVTATIGAGEEVHRTGGILVNGGRLLVTGGKLFLNGTMMIVHGGTVEFDGAEFHQEGDNKHILVGGIDPNGSDGDGYLTFRNGSRLHWKLSYTSQQELHARNNSRIVLDQSRVDCDQATAVIRLFDTASYSASNVTAAKQDDPDLPGCWSTWYINENPRPGDSATLTLASVMNAGDVMLYGAAQVDVRNTVGIMPWLYYPRGSSADLSFPEASECTPKNCPRVSKTLEGSTGWRVNIQDSALVMWGIDTYPGSDVTVSHSKLAMALVRFAEDKRYTVPGDFVNGTHYVDNKFERSLPDRNLHLVDTDVKWWKLDVIQLAQARMDSVVFSEMVTKQFARAYLTNSTCEGQTIHLGALDNSWIYFQHGTVETFVSVWSQAFMVLDDSNVDYQLAEFPRQTRNIAHDQARLYALNGYFRQLPEAMDYSLVTFAALGAFREDLQTTARTPTPVAGSAWILKGPNNTTVVFDQWILALRAPGSQDWTEIARGNSEVRDAPLATIPPNLLWSPGEYSLRLSLVVRGDDPNTPYPTWAYPAVKKLIVK